MREPACRIVAALGLACLSGLAFADLTNPYYTRARASYVANDLAHACPDLKIYRQQDRAFLERPENLQTRQQIDEVVRYCESRQALNCPPGYTCPASVVGGGTVVGAPAPDH